MPPTTRKGSFTTNPSIQRTNLVWKQKKHSSPLFYAAGQRTPPNKPETARQSDETSKQDHRYLPPHKSVPAALLRREVFDHNVNSPLADRATHVSFLEPICATKACHLVRSLSVDQAGVPLLGHAHDAKGIIVALVVV